MRSEIAIAARMTAATLVLTGLAYPLLITAIAQAVFPRQANGSLVMASDGRVVGSQLIAQGFKAAGYLQPRPSAAGADGYDATGSSGSNLGPTSAKLRERVAFDLKRLQAENPGAGAVPIELVTASGSGLDPHVSPDAARWQAPRVAGARGLAVEDVLRLLESSIEPRVLGFLGEPRLNVLLLNLELDRRFGRPGEAGAGGR